MRICKCLHDSMIPCDDVAGVTLLTFKFVNERGGHVRYKFSLVVKEALCFYGL